MLKNKNTKKIMLTTMIISLSLALNYSCSNTPNNTSTPTSSTKNVDYGRKIVGKATFPETRKAKVDFRIKANTSDVSKISTISLILPHDATSNQNKTIATGMTDSDGNFLIDTTKITLAPNTIYILEASKRSETNNIMTIRTLIKWNGNEWAGIAQSGEILIDQNTTALSAISNFTNTQSESLILSLPVEEGITTGADIANTSITKDDIKNVGEMVSSILQGGRDPIALLRYDASKAYKYYVDQTYNYKSLTTDNGCNGCSFIGADLKTSGSSLAGKDLSYADLRGQDLSQADLSGTILIGANLEGATLPQDLSYLNLSYTNLKGQDLTQSDVTGTNFTYSNLENCILSKESDPKDLTKARFTGASFKNSELTGANLSKVHLFEATFDGTKIKQVNFEKADMTGADLSNVYGKDIQDINFNENNLTGASFSTLDISNTDLSTSKVEGANFSKTIMTKNYGHINRNLNNCNFSEAIFDGLVFSGNISNSNFSRAKLNNIIFISTNCSNCDFSES